MRACKLRLTIKRERKLNTLDLSNQKVYLYFDGIYMESDVYVNGVKVISNKWYNPFCVEITDYLNFNSNDTLAIFVRNQQPSSRWYSGSGIIRNVYLVTGNDVEVGLNDVKITYPNLETEYNSDVNTVYVNTMQLLLQGSASDILKKAMVEIDNIFEKENIKSKMLLQVHDELIFNVYKDELDKVKDIVYNTMTKVFDLKVPLDVDIEVGNNWYEAK